MPETPSALVDTVTALLLEEGFEGISVRKVATRAGVSIGAVQHHFPTKDAMLTAAMDAASDAFRRGLEARVGRDHDPRRALRLVCEELLGARPDQRPGSVLWVARLARAEVDRSTARRHEQEWAEVDGLILALLRASRADLSLARARDEAATLLALVDGLAVSVLREPERMPPARARRLLRRRLDALLERT